VQSRSVGAYGQLVFWLLLLLPPDFYDLRIILRHIELHDHLVFKGFDDTQGQPMVKIYLTNQEEIRSLLLWSR
jgi:hypothetical protein